MSVHCPSCGCKSCRCGYKDGRYSLHCPQCGCKSCRCGYKYGSESVSIVPPQPTAADKIEELLKRKVELEVELKQIDDQLDKLRRMLERH